MLWEKEYWNKPIMNILTALLADCLLFAHRIVSFISVHMLDGKP